MASTPATSSAGVKLQWPWRATYVWRRRPSGVLCARCAIASNCHDDRVRETQRVARQHDGMSCAELARWAFVTPQAMNALVSRLEQRRLVRRRRDPTHGRVLRASVTAKGLDALARCDHAMDTIEHEMLRDVPPEAADALGQTLASCAHAPEATRPRLPPRVSADPGDAP
jgi:DNA-binding MarR family transcriptional regulator